LYLLLTLALMLSGCSTIGRGSAGSTFDADCLADIGDTPAEITGVFVEPDDGYSPVLDELAHADCTIDVTIYMLTDDLVFDALIDAAGRGVRVRVILDEHPFGMFGDQQEAMDRLEAGGVDVIWGPDHFQFTHAKYIVVDSRVALIMNLNLTRSAFNGNREFGVVTTEADPVAQAQAVFDADWNGTSAENVSGPLIVSPETSRSRIVALMNKAESSIAFYAEVIRDDGIIATLREAVQRGVYVRLIVNSSVDPADLESLVELSTIGVEVRMMEAVYIHAKTLIIDGEAALIGSQNYTMTSLDRNREVGMVVDDPALMARVVAVYERDWSRAIPAGAVPAANADEWIWERGTVYPSPLLEFAVKLSAYPLTLIDESGYSVRTVPRGWAHGIGQPAFIQADIAAGRCPSPFDRRCAGGERYALRGDVSKRPWTRFDAGTQSVGTFV
jgi:phosphatidylserine/phosphatidylglycerophosphate/cardiolipin synthase-like enzyme